jgi:SAM-dependent methyltransferase
MIPKSLLADDADEIRDWPEREGGPRRPPPGVRLMALDGAIDRFKRWLAIPALRELHVDDPRTTLLRRQILETKPFLRKVYLEWYGRLLEALPRAEGRVLELGSGGGFLKQLLPSLLTSEIVAWEGVALVADGQRLPIRSGSLRAIVMTSVFHHLPDPAAFLREAARCVRPGGVVAMVEPWVTAWSRFVYRHLRHEPFVPDAPEWAFPSDGPLSGANGALPWIVFRRDRRRFEKELPEWSLERIEPFMPVRYLLSGGLSLKTLVPGFAFGVSTLAEKALNPIMEDVAMFALIVLRRRSDA